MNLPFDPSFYTPTNIAVVVVVAIFMIALYVVGEKVENKEAHKMYERNSHGNH